MSTEILPSADFARQWWNTGAAREDGAHAIRADREQIAAWCDGKAAEAKREAEAHASQIGVPPGAYDDDHRERVHRCEGQASAFEALAAMLRGAK